MGVEVENKKLGEAGKEHRAFPRSESQATSELKAEPTPRPWTLDIEEEEGSHWRNLSIREINRMLHDSDWAGPEDWERDLANAELIVRAVNAHDALVKACNAAMPVVNFYAQLLSDPNNREHYLKIGRQMRAALALANSQDSESSEAS